MADSKPEPKTESTKPSSDPSLPTMVLITFAPLAVWVAIVSMVMNFAH